MANEISTISKNQNMDTSSNEPSFTKEQIDLIRRTIAKDATPDEMSLFLYHSKKCGLDPLAKQIYFQRRKNNKTDEYQMTIITSIDGFRLVASRTGEHAGTDDAVFDDEREPSKATVTVYRVIAGAARGFTASARWTEYCPQSGQDYMWQKMPCTMLGKCAEALALRKAFPQELGGTYTKEEMDQAGPGDHRPSAHKPAASLPPEDMNPALGSFNEFDQTTSPAMPTAERKQTVASAITRPEALDELFKQGELLQMSTKDLAGECQKLFKKEPTKMTVAEIQKLTQHVKTLGTQK